MNQMIAVINQNKLVKKKVVDVLDHAQIEIDMRRLALGDLLSSVPVER